MRAPRTGRWGSEPIGAGAGAGKRAGGKGQGGKKGGRALQTSRPLSHPLTHPCAHSSGICTCKEVQVPSLSLAPGCRVPSSGIPKWPDPLPLSHLTQVPLPSCPRTLWPALLRWCPPRAGELLHCVSEKGLGEGRDADSLTLVPALSLLSLLSPHGSFSPNVLQRGAPSKPPRSLRPLRQPSQPQSSASTPTPGRCRSHRASERVPCACRGVWGRARASCPSCLWPQGQPGG